MTNSILIGKLIYSTIQASSDVKAVVDDRVYPIVAPNDTDFPFIVYTRGNAYCNTLTKDGWLEDKVSFQISVASDTYIESAELANDVRDLFENFKISNDELEIENIRMTSCAESFNEDTYIQTLYFECDAN